MMCIGCKFAETLQDNRGATHSICVCRESNKFLEAVLLVFDGCECWECEKDGGEE